MAHFFIFYGHLLVFIRYIEEGSSKKGSRAMKLFEIYHQQGEDFLRFAQSLTHHREEAEDLVQQAYLKALGQLELFEVMEAEQIPKDPKDPFRPAAA